MRFFEAVADPAGVTALRIQGQRLTENDCELAQQPLTAAPV